MSSLHFRYYGADAIPSVQDTIDTLAGSLTTDAEINRIIGPMMGATAKGVGAYLRLVYKAEDLPPMPERLSDLVRRAA